MNGDLTINDAAMNLCSAIRLHAQFCDTEPANITAIEAAATQVTRAVADYADAIFRKEGFYISFDAPWEDPSWSQEPTEESSELARPSEPETEELIIDDRYTVHVENQSALVKFTESVTSHRVKDPVGALRVLCGKDGWSPMAYAEGMLRVTYHAVDAV